jgi:hypothetical protein
MTHQNEGPLLGDKGSPSRLSPCGSDDTPRIEPRPNSQFKPRRAGGRMPMPGEYPPKRGWPEKPTPKARRACCREPFGQTG